MWQLKSLYEEKYRNHPIQSFKVPTHWYNKYRSQRPWCVSVHTVILINVYRCIVMQLQDIISTPTSNKANFGIDRQYCRYPSFISRRKFELSYFCRVSEEKKKKRNRVWKKFFRPAPSRLYSNAVIKGKDFTVAVTKDNTKRVLEHAYVVSSSWIVAEVNCNRWLGRISEPWIQPLLTAYEKPSGGFQFKLCPVCATSK